MKVFLRLLVLVALGLLLPPATQTRAQALFLSVTTQTNIVGLDRPLIYHYELTNLIGVALYDIRITNTPSSQVLLNGATNTQGSVTNNNTSLIFLVGNMAYGGVARFDLSVSPTASGYLTNEITMAIGTLTNLTYVTNVVTFVTAPQAEIGVRVTPPSNPVFLNDLFTYRVTVTNRGPETTGTVVLSNAIPTGITLISVSPTNPPYTLQTNGVLLFALNRLAAGSSRSFAFEVQATNARTYNFVAQADTSRVNDTNISNNTGAASVTVNNYFPALLLVTTNSPQVLNRQNGLLEQSILISNIGSNTVNGVRVFISGLSNVWVNPTGTNSSAPYALFPTALAQGQSGSLLVQYYVPNRTPFPFSNSQLLGLAVSAPDLTPPATPASTNKLTINRILPLASGSPLIEFSAATNRNFTVIYSDSVTFSNAMATAPANMPASGLAQWIDYGPPLTISHPTNTTRRFYRLRLNP